MITLFFLSQQENTSFTQSLCYKSKGFSHLGQVEQKQQPSQQQAEETLYAEPILVNQSKPNPLGRIYSPIGKL